jgi:hypothetical protein
LTPQTAFSLLDYPKEPVDQIRRLILAFMIFCAPLQQNAHKGHLTEALRPQTP